MANLGDYAEDATLNTKFPSRDTDSTPTALVSGAASVYKSDGVTQSTAGVTLTTSFDSHAGLNNVKVDLSSDAFYATGNDYQIVLTAGTVGGNSVVGSVIAEFSIENRFMRGTDSANTTAPLTAAQVNTEVDTAISDAGLAASIAALKDFDPAVDAVANVTLVTTTTTNTDMRGTDSANTTAPNTTTPDNAGILAAIAALNDFNPATTEIDIGKINGVTIIGTGTSEDLFRPA